MDIERYEIRELLDTGELGRHLVNCRVQDGRTAARIRAQHELRIDPSVKQAAVTHVGIYTDEPTILETVYR